MRRALFALAGLVLAGCSTKVATPPVISVPPQQEVVIVKPQPVDPRYRARLHTELSAGYLARGQLAVALEEGNEAIRLDSDYAPAYGVLGLVYMGMREDAKAQQSFARALALAPDDPEVHNNYGWFLCQTGREKESIAQFELALGNPLYRTPELAMLNAAQCSERMGEIRAAQSFFRRVLVVQPLNLPAHYGLARIAYKTAQFEEAREHLKSLMRTPTPGPDTLLLGVCVERRLGDRASETSYARQLTNRYPDSPQAAKLRGQACE